MFGNLEKNEIEELLGSQIIGRIGCNADRKTYIVPISYAYDGEYIYCHTMEGMKVAMMRTNPYVCFEVDVLENLGNWKSVITWGEFEEITEHEEKRKAVEKLYLRMIPIVPSTTLQLTSQWPFPPDKTETIAGILFRIKLEEKTGRFESTKLNHYGKIQG